MLVGAGLQAPLAPAPPADGQRSPTDCANPRDELRRLALEVEPVVLSRAPAAPSTVAAPGTSPLSPGSAASTPPIIGYQPTYRAVLAKRGYLVKNTLGTGSYSKVGPTFDLLTSTPFTG